MDHLLLVWLFWNFVDPRSQSFLGKLHIQCRWFALWCLWWIVNYNFSNFICLYKNKKSLSTQTVKMGGLYKTDSFRILVFVLFLQWLSLRIVIHILNQCMNQSKPVWQYEWIHSFIEIQPCRILTWGIIWFSENDLSFYLLALWTILKDSLRTCATSLVSPLTLKKWLGPRVLEESLKKAKNVR